MEKDLVPILQPVTASLAYWGSTRRGPWSASQGSVPNQGRVAGGDSPGFTARSLQDLNSSLSALAMSILAWICGLGQAEF